jgi:hypothetical protein
MPASPSDQGAPSAVIHPLSMPAPSCVIMYLQYRCVLFCDRRLHGPWMLPAIVRYFVLLHGTLAAQRVAPLGILQFSHSAPGLP